MARRRAEPERPRIAREECIAILAGGGMLPVQLAKKLRDEGQRAIVFRIDGEALPESCFAGLPCETRRLEDFPDLARHLRRHDVRHLVMAGSVERRPRLGHLRWSTGLLRLLPQLARALLLGDDGLLRHIVRHVEHIGVEVIGVHELLPDVVTTVGPQGSRAPSRNDWKDIDAAFEAASAIGVLDIGQAAIAIGGRAIALEGIEGTDGLLERTVALRQHGRLAGATGGVLAKCAKPGQELRADLPAIGVRTVHDAARAGLRGIALQAGRTLILEREETLAAAEREGMFIIGIEPGAQGSG